MDVKPVAKQYMGSGATFRSQVLGRTTATEYAKSLKVVNPQNGAERADRNVTTGSKYWKRAIVALPG